jgi:hypothetical protein
LKKYVFGPRTLGEHGAPVQEKGLVLFSTLQFLRANRVN